MTKTEKCYFSTTIREFKVSKNQLENAIKEGIIKEEKVINSHYKTGPPARLLFRSEIKKNLKKILAYPKASKSEKEMRKIYVKRSKARGELDFFCEKCAKTIRACRDSMAFESFYSGELTKEKAIALLKAAHYRHEHTDYDSIRYQEYEKNREIGMSWEESHEEARETARKRIRRLS